MPTLSRFPGQYFGKETNAHDNNHRDYDPKTGRYLQFDPIGLQGEINTYTYGYISGNPLSYIDSKGTQIVIPVPPLQESRGGGGICEKALEICLKGANA